MGLAPLASGRPADEPFCLGWLAPPQAVEGSLEAMLEAAASEAAGDKENGEANGDVLCQLGLLPAAAAAGGLSTSRKLPMWSQFERLFAAEAKKRAALRRQRRQARSRPISPDLARPISPGLPCIWHAAGPRSAPSTVAHLERSPRWQAAAERQHVGGDGDGGVIDPEVWVNEHAEERPDGELRGADDEGEGGGAHGGYFEHDDGFGGDDGHDAAPRAPNAVRPV